MVVVCNSNEKNKQSNKETNNTKQKRKLVSVQKRGVIDN